MLEEVLPLRHDAPAGVGDGLWNLSRVLSGLAIAVTAVLLAFALTAYARTGDGIGGDFLTDYAGGYLVRTGDGHSLYDIQVQEHVQQDLSPAGADDDVNPFVLPPAAAWIFAPLSALPYRTAHVLFAIINLAALAGVLLLFWSELRGVDTRLRAAFFIAFALSMPAVTDISWGQIDLLLVAATLLGWRFLRTGSDLLAGCALSLALLKPHFLIGVVLLLLLRRQWKTMLVLAGLGFIVLVPPALLIGTSALGDYVSLVVGRTELPAYIDAQPQHMANWRGLMSSIVGRDDRLLWLPGAVLIGLTALAVCVRSWRLDPRSPRSYAMAVILPLLVSPHVHMQSMMLLFVAIAVMLQAGMRDVALPGGRRLDGAAALLFMQVALFVGWFLTANEIAVMVLITAGVFCWCAFTPMPRREQAEETLPLAA